jgi:hypothetical protein
MNKNEDSERVHKKHHEKWKIIMFFLFFIAFSIVILILAYQASQNMALLAEQYFKNEQEIKTVEPDEIIQEAKEERVESDLDENYYSTFHNDIDTELYYQIDFETKERNLPEENLEMFGTFPVISGGIKNQEDINAYIEDLALYVWNYYSTEIEESEDKPLDWYWQMNSYVTYTSETVMSVVIEETWASEESWYMNITSINIDVENGFILENDQILNIYEEFAENFITRSNIQNGSVEVLEYMSPYEVYDFLSDSNSNIIFYTPLGMEVGFIYVLDDTMGYVTATYQDYEKYLKNF